MRLILWLPVLVVVLLMVLEGPAPAQGAPAIASTFSNIPNSLKEFGNNLKDAFESIPEATRLGIFPGLGRAGSVDYVQDCSNAVKPVNFQEISPNRAKHRDDIKQGRLTDNQRLGRGFCRFGYWVPFEVETLSFFK
uniref:Apolipoprotein C-I n=1 Tax=Felis catus TaxID=9685 RepID=A0ABI7Y4M6_FELCA